MRKHAAGPMGIPPKATVHVMPPLALEEVHVAIIIRSVHPPAYAKGPPSSRIEDLAQTRHGILHNARQGV